MVSPVLIIAAVVLAVLVIVANLYFLVYFQHEDDRNVAILPKIVVVTGLTLSCFSVLLLPFDVAIGSDSDSTRFHMENIWQVCYMAMAVLMVAVIPFSLYYYESEDPESDSKHSQLYHAFVIEFFTLLVAGLTIGLMYAFLGVVDIPTQAYSTNVTLPPYTDFQVAETTTDFTCASDATTWCVGSKDLVSIGVTFPVYCIGLISFVGWFLFVAFGGIGLAALPLDLFAEYRFRPKRIALDEYARQKVAIKERASKLSEIGKQFEREGRHKKKNRKNQKLYNKFKQAVYFLERDWTKLSEAYKQQGGNPIYYWFIAFLALITTCLSLLWLIHIVLFLFIDPPVSPFLNDIFTHLDGVFPLLGTIIYGIFSYYLLWAVIKGNMKMGLRFLFFTIHPMKIGGTLMNSFLFNVWLILLCSFPVVQFCTVAFGLYTHGSAIENLFGIQVTNLKFLRYFFVENVFLYALFGLTGLTFLYLALFPKDRRKKNTEDDEDNWLAV